MKKVLLLGLLVCLLLSSFSFGQSPIMRLTPKDEGHIIEGEIILALKTDAGKSVQMDALSLASLDGFYVKDSLKGSVATLSKMDLNAIGDVYLLGYAPKTYPDFKAAAHALEEALTAAGHPVKYIEPNYEVKALGSMEAIHNSQAWHYNMIKVPQAWQYTTGSSAVKVAVLDTGIDHNHQSLRNLVNTTLGYNFTGGSTSDTMDRQGHGTHVAGTIGSYGVVSGVMQNVTLIPVKVLGDNGSGTTYGIQQGVIFAANQGADVINMSLGGGGYSQGMNDACNYAVSKGTIVIAATGNDGRGSISYPAAYASVIAVGSVDSNRVRSSFSNYGQGLDLVAPGRNIYSTYPNNRYTSLSGTSMATPHVAGVAGLMRAINPSLTVARAKEILLSTAQAAGAANQYGAGIVDAQAAVLAARGGGTNPTPITVTAYEIRNRQTWTSTYFWWTRYHLSADVYVHLSDGTVHFHGNESAFDYANYPVIQKTISGTARAQTTGQNISYQFPITIQ